MMMYQDDMTLADHQANLCASPLWQTHARTEKCDTGDSLDHSNVISTLATRDFSELGFHAGANPALDAAGRKAVAKTHSLRTRGGRLGLLLNPSSTPADYDALARCNDNHTRFATARLVAKELSEDSLVELAFDSQAAPALAAVTGLPNRIYGLVMGHRDALFALVQNPDCPKSLLESVLSGDNRGVTHLLGFAVKNPSVPIELLLRLPSTAGLTDGQFERAVLARKAEAEEWLSEEYGNDLDLDTTPLEWVRELLSS